MDIEVLHGEISLRIASILVGLQWKMISMGAQGSIPKEQQVKALHLYVNKLDIALAKPQLMEVYISKPAPGHTFPLHIWMWLVPEIDTILNMKGQANTEWLRACQTKHVVSGETSIHQDMWDWAPGPL